MENTECQKKSSLYDITLKITKMSQMTLKTKNIFLTLLDSINLLQKYFENFGQNFWLKFWQTPNLAEISTEFVVCQNFSEKFIYVIYLWRGKFFTKFPESEVNYVLIFTKFSSRILVFYPPWENNFFTYKSTIQNNLKKYYMKKWIRKIKLFLPLLPQTIKFVFL